MTNELSVHPPKDDLIAFGLGKLESGENERIEKHLEGCPDCCETILELKDDTFVGLVRTSRSPASAPTNPDATLDVAVGTPTRFDPVARLPTELRSHARYEVSELIGRGGMGDVYKAQHKVMNRPVALKVIKPELVQNEAAVQRFHREVQAAARLHDRNIVNAYDAEQAGNLHFLVMEFVDGVNLDEVVRQRGALPVAQACDYIRQAAKGLQHAHELGMVHRDIKPHNLMLTSTGEVKILDFGLAGFASEAQVDELQELAASPSETVGLANHQLTQAGSMMGTPDYIAPEQARDAHAADIRADIYSLGCTFYTLLAGRTPFGQRTVMEKIKAHTEEKAEPLAKLRDYVPPEVEAILLKMMAKNPAERYSTPAELIHALDRYIEQRIDEKLRERGLDKSPPLKSRTAIGNDEASQWYDRLAGFMWSVAWINILGGSLLALLVTWLWMSQVVGLVGFVQKPLVLLILASTIPSAFLLTVVPKVRHMQGYGWTLLGILLCLLPSLGFPLGLIVGYLSLYYLLSPQYRLPLGAAPRLSFREGLTYIAIVLSPLAFVAIGAAASFVFYLQTENGVVRVEVADESLQVKLNGQTIEMKDGTVPLSIRAGEQQLIIRRGDFEFRTDNFELRRGDEVGLKVSFVAGEVVVQKDGERIGAQPVPDDLRNLQNRLIPTMADEGEPSALGLMLRDRLRGIRQIGTALLEYQKKHGSFPPTAKQRDAFDASGRPHLSWRVHLLPFLGEQKLFEKFRLDQPWDSAHNKPLLEEMPDVYKPSADPTRTQLLAVVGKGTAYEGQAGLKLSDFHDGTSFTAYVVDAGPEKAVPWTKPEDLTFNAEDPIQAFGKADFGDEFIVLMADSTFRPIPYNTAPESLRALFTRAAKDKFDELAKRAAPLPLTIGMNDEFGMLFEGRLVAPAELSRRLGEALKENPGRVVAINFPKRPWTVAEHVDQLEQIARIAGAMWITRPTWSQIRIVMSVDKSGQHTLDIEGPGYSSTGLLEDQRPNVREVIAKNPNLPVQIEVVEPFRFSDPKNVIGLAKVRDATKAAGDKVRVVRTRRNNVNPPESLNQIQELHRLQSHTGSIERLAFIDNTRFVSAGLTGEEYIWDARQGKRVQTLTERDRLLTAVAAAPAAGLFATGNTYGQIRLWNKDLTTTGTIKGPETILQTLAMSADGSLLMSSGVSFVQDPALLAKALMPRIWNTKTQELVRTLDSKSGLIMAAAFTPDGKRLVTGGMAKHLSVWNVATGELLSKIELGMEVRTLSLSPDGRLAAVASSDPVVIVDLQTKEVTHRFNGHTLRVQSVAFLPDGRHVVSGSQDKTWRVWSLADSREIAKVAGTTPHTHGLAVSPDGKLVVGGGGEPYDHATKSFPKNGDYDLRVWELPESLWPIEGASADRIVVEISADGQFRLAGRALNSLELANRLKGMLEEDPEREVHVIHAERFRGPPFQALLGLVRSAGGKNVTWPGQELDDKSLVEVKRFTGHSRPVNFVTFSPDGKLIASASGMPRGDNTVRIWDRESGKTLHVLEGHQASITFAAFSPDGSRLLTGDINRRQILWNPATGERIKGWIWKGSDENEVTHINEVVFSANGSRIFFVRVGAKPAIQVADADSGELLKTFPLAGLGMPAIALTADGSQLLVPRADGTVELFDAQTGDKVRTFAAAPIAKGESPNALAVAISPDGKKVAAGYKAHRVRVWDFVTGEVIRDIHTDNFTTGRLAFLADSRRLVAGGPVVQAHPDSPVACLVDCDTGEVLARTPAILGHGHAFALAPDGQHFVTGGGLFAVDGKTETTGDNDLRLWRLPESVPPPPKPNHTQSLVDHKGPVIALHHPPFSESLQRVHGEGNFLLSLGRDVNLFKWPATKLTQERSSSGIVSAGEPLGAADLSADGKLAAVSWPQLGMVEVWTVVNETGTSERQLTLREQALKNVEFLRFSPDGKRLFTVTPTTQVLWSLADGGKRLRDFSQKTTAAAFSADGKRLAVAQDGSVKSIVVLNIENPERVRIDVEVARPTPSTLSSLAFSADGRRLALGQDDGTVTVFELPSKKILQTVRGSTTVAGAISHLEFSEGDRLLVVGVGGQLVQFWNWQANELLYEAVAPPGSARQVCLSPDGRKLFAAGGEAVSSDTLKPEPTNDYRIYVWDLPESLWPAPPKIEKINLLRELPGSKEWITAVAYPENDRAVTVAVDGVVRVWKQGGAELDSHQLPFGGQAAISPDGRLVVVASAANDKDRAKVALWELDGWRERWKIEVPTTTTTFTPKFLVDVRFAPNNRVLVRHNVDSGLAVVDATTGEILSRFPKKGPAMGAASLSPDGQRLFVRQMAPAPFGRIYRIEDGAELAKIDTRDVVLDAVWSPDGAQLILAESTLKEGRIAVFNASSGELVRRWIAEPKGIESLALGQGNLLATGGLTRIAVWDWSKGKLLAAIDSPKQDGDARLAIAISPDGKQLISGGARWLDGEDRLPRLWQLPESVWPQAPQPERIGRNRDFEVDAQKLIGKWKSTDKEAKSWIASAEFQADGKLSVTGEFNGKTHDVAGTYKVDGYKLLMNIGDQAMDEELSIFQLTDKVLVATAKNGKKLNFERVESKKGEM